MTSPATLHQQRWGQFGLINLLLLIFGVELACGIAVIADPHRSEPVQLIGYALVTSLLVGIARAWELVGGADTGIIASIAVLTGRAPGPPGPDGVAAPGTADTPEADDAPGPEPDARVLASAAGRRRGMLRSWQAKVSGLNGVAGVEGMRALVIWHVRFRT